MKDNIELSIIIPVYNVQDYLTECLESAYKVIGINKEIIIVNDGSTDNSDVIINQFLQLYPDQTIVETQINQGQSVARNVGLNLAKGDYILFLDSDDTFEHEAVIEIFNYAKQHDLDLVQGRATEFGDVPRAVMIMPDEVLNTDICSGAALLKKWCDTCHTDIGDFRPEVWLMLVKRSLFISNEIKFVVGMFYEDELIVPTLLLSAKKAKALDIPFYNYRIRQGSTIRSVNERHIASKGKLTKEYYSLLSKNKFYHPFLNGRLIGWTKESEAYLSIRDIAQVFALRKFKFKELIRLTLIFIRAVGRFGRHKSIDDVLFFKK